VAEGVAARRGRAAYPRELPRVEAERVADAVERERVREVAVEERDDVARDGEGPGLYPVRLGLQVDQARLDMLDNLVQERVRCLRWPRGCAFARLRLFFFHAPVGYRRDGPGPTFF
jgi:hypothetical protein